MQLETLVLLIALIFSIVLHEIAHGYAAESLGDPTARLAGRLTLNPVKHVDPIGSLFVPLLLLFTNAPLLFGWAKPVPYNPYNLRAPKWGEALVAAAGPGTNLLLALLFSLVARFSDSPMLVSLASAVVVMNVLLAIVNLIPIPPLDGSKVLEPMLPYALLRPYERLKQLFEANLLLSFGVILIVFYLGLPYVAGLIGGISSFLLGA